MYAHLDNVLPAFAAGDITDDLEAHTKARAYLAIRRRADHLLNFTDISFRKFGVAAGLSPYLRAMRDAIACVLLRRDPTQMTRVDASAKPIATRVAYLVPATWGGTVNRFTDYAMRHVRATFDRYQSVAFGIAGVGPNQTLIAVMRNGRALKKPLRISVRRSAPQGVSVVDEPLVVHTTKTAFSRSHSSATFDDFADTCHTRDY